jgi:2-polyprenyl-6-methoxyphenol hydroxylase-like FAD-dependent oxidoreductase
MAGTNPLTNAIVIGAGFAGLSVAIELAKRGVKVLVFETAPDMKRQGMRRTIISYPEYGGLAPHSCVDCSKGT